MKLLFVLLLLSTVATRADDISTMRAADDIEREINRRIAERIVPGMRFQDYHIEVSRIVVRVTAEFLAAQKAKQ